MGILNGNFKYLGKDKISWWVSSAFTLKYGTIYFNYFMYTVLNVDSMACA